VHNAHQEEHPGRECSCVKMILIVEDDPGIGQYIFLTISRETPYLSLLVTDSVRALEVVKHIRPNLFILDYRLSSVNGVELYDQLHLTEGLETIPAIIMSADLPREQLENEIKQRYLVALPNPHDRGGLLQTIEQVFASVSQGTVTDRGGGSGASSHH
jgi:DNA-binding NtrC family response regulator